MPLALLLSPDDQAVSAITAVLEEMSVTWERPLDGVSAAKQLNSHNFDLVLVDCENLPAAKLIFDVCRRGKAGHNPVPIAIVDGRAGLPTAFRLGAELILTKPVAKDQARGTVRTAVSRIKKEDPARSAQPADAASATQTDAPHAYTHEPGTNQAEGLLTGCEISNESASHTTPEPQALAASAAGAAWASPASSGKTVSVSSKSASALTTSAASCAPAFEAVSGEKTSRISEEPKPASNVKLSDDPVLAEIERAEQEKTASQPEGPAFSSYAEKKSRSRGPLVALLVIALAAGGFYAAWMYQPGFRALAQPQIDRLLVLTGLSRPSQAPASTPVRPATKPSPAPVSATPTDPGQTQPAVPGAPGTAPSSASPTPATPPSTTTPGAAVAQPASPASGGATPASAKLRPANLDTTKAGANLIPAKQDAGISNAATGSTSNAELPDEKNAFILSSKGAEKRLTHSVPPIFPLSARSDGTVVLKAVVDENGKVVGARVVEGNAALVNAAIVAVKQWRYRPYLREGKAQPFQTVVLMDFQRP